MAWAACDALTPEVKHLHLFADNTTALRAIFDSKAKADQAHAKRFRNYIEEVLGRDQGNTVEIAWSLGHTKIRGNERADELAKAAAEMWYADETTTLKHEKRTVKERALERWTDSWKKYRGLTGRFGPADHIPPA